MANAALGKEDMKALKAAARRHVRAGMKPKAALAKAIDAELAESSRALADEQERGKPASARNIDFSLHHDHS